MTESVTDCDNFGVTWTAPPRSRFRFFGNRLRWALALFSRNFATASEPQGSRPQEVPGEQKP
jgi:hypothetical protein